MENRVVLSTFAKEKNKKIINVSQNNTNISIQWSETLKPAGGERSLQAQSHEKENIPAGEAEPWPGHFLHLSKWESAMDRATPGTNQHPSRSSWSSQ